MLADKRPAFNGDSALRSPSDRPGPQPENAIAATAEEQARACSRPVRTTPPPEQPELPPAGVCPRLSNTNERQSGTPPRGAAIEPGAAAFGPAVAHVLSEGLRAPRCPRGAVPLLQTRTDPSRGAVVEVG